ncbi:hypothetical protein RJ640_030683 [Escallonia rubra]|uniref:Beta-hexosaminidase n=1 Tax=Escallonia rubra TaxID=112253 RepID=A0AA88UNM1_9ASTE|nr:hypothetical protein RJ640_030683 [Escallonia rubra]
MMITTNSPKPNPNKSLLQFLFLINLLFVNSRIIPQNPLPSLSDDPPVYLWPLPSKFTSGDQTLTVSPDLSLYVDCGSLIVRDAFERYRGIIFKHCSGSPSGERSEPVYDITNLIIIVHSDNEELQLGVDESYSLFVTKNDGLSIVGQAVIEANSVYGALRGLEVDLRTLISSGLLSIDTFMNHTFSQLCTFDYETKTVKVYKAPWYIRDKPRFVYRGLLLDTSRHYLPIDVIKQILEAMSYAKLLKFTLEPSSDHVDYLLSVSHSLRKSSVRLDDENRVSDGTGAGYPDLWPSPSCREPLDVTKNFTFDVLSGILTDMRKIFPFELFHLGGDEVNTACEKDIRHHSLKSNPAGLAESNGVVGLMVDSIHYGRLDAGGGDDGEMVRTCVGGGRKLQEHNMTAKDAYQYFVLRAQEIAISKNWTPVNWLGPGVCPRAVAKGFRCIYSNQGVWYLDHIDVPWDSFYNAEPLEGINNASEQELVLGGEVCMWSEVIDASNVQQTIWPRAAAAAERLWSTRGSISSGNTTAIALPRLQYFRCLLTRRGVQAAPVTNKYARSVPNGPGETRAAKSGDVASD